MRAAPEGEAAGAKTRRRRPKAGQRRPKAGRRVRRQGDGAGKQGSDARKRGGDRFLYLFQKIFNASGARKRRGSARRRGSGARKQGDGTGKQGGGGEDKATAHKDVTAAIAFYIFFKNFSIPRKRRGEHPAF